MLLFSATAAAGQTPYGLNGNRPDYEVREIMEDREREQRINRFIEENNRRTQQSIDGLEDKLRNAMRRNSPATGSQPQGGTAPRGGLQFSVDRPAPRAKGQTRKQRDEQRRRERDAEHRRWLEERRQQIAEQRRRDAERERRRREREAELARLRYDTNYRAEYARTAGYYARKSDEAHWRTHEGAEILDATHRAENLMYGPVEKNFEQGAGTAGRGHRLKTIRRRRPAVTGLDSHAIPYGTMAANARPWSEWRASAVVVDSIPRPHGGTKLRINLSSPGQWRRLAEEIPPELMSNLRAAIYHESDGNIPGLVYEPGRRLYYLYVPENRKIISFPVDGTEITVHSLTEKDDRLAEMWSTIKKSAKFSAGFNALGMIDSKVSFTPGKGEVEGKMNAGPAGVSLSESGIGLKAGKAEAKADFGKEEVSVSTEIYKDRTPVGKKEKPEIKDSEKKKKLIPEIKGELAAEIKLYENSSEIRHKKIYLSSSSSMPSFAIEGSVGAGVEAKASASASAGVNTKVPGGNGLEAKVQGDLNFARAGVEVTVMQKPPLYNGMCFLTVGTKAKAGYSYMLKFGKEATPASANDGEKAEGIASVNLGAIPLSLTGMAGLKCYYTDEMNRAYAEKETSE